MFGRASTLLRNLSCSLSEQLTGYIISGGGAEGSYPADWNPSFPYQLGTFICNGASAQYANSITRQ